jgi:hydroxyacylglutathione hydrolase
MYHILSHRTHIFNTHHHWDHTGGNLELKKDGVQVYGPLIEKDKIPGIDKTLQGGDEFTFGTNKCKVIDVGGHTVGHIAYHFPAEKFAFVGDSLFSLGCGRMFEGQPDQFWASLKRLRELPDETTIYWYVQSIMTICVDELSSSGS